MILRVLEIGFLALAVVASAKSDIFFLFYFVPLVIEIVKDLRADEMISFFRKRASSQTLLFIAVMAIIMASAGVNFSREVVNVLILSGFLMKGVLSTDALLKRNVVIKWTGGVMALMLALFALLSHGFSLETLIEFIPAALVFVATLLALKNRWAGSCAYFCIAILVFYFSLRSWNPHQISGRLAVMLLLGFPLAYLGFQSLRKEVE